MVTTILIQRQSLKFTCIRENLKTDNQNILAVVPKHARKGETDLSYRNVALYTNISKLKFKAFSFVSWTSSWMR